MRNTKQECERRRVSGVGSEMYLVSLSGMLTKEEGEAVIRERTPQTFPETQHKNLHI